MSCSSLRVQLVDASNSCPAKRSERYSLVNGSIKRERRCWLEISDLENLILKMAESWKNGEKLKNTRRLRWARYSGGGGGGRREIGLQSEAWGKATGKGGRHGFL